MSYILVSGKEVACDAPVILWEESGLRFDGLGKRSTTTCVVLHHTGGVGMAPQVFRTLKTRTDKRGKLLNLSVHFCVEPNGNVYQFVDADRRCAHAGSVDDTNNDGLQLSGNSCSIGIEVINPASSVASARGIRRALVREEIHGVEQVATAFTAEQTASTIALCRSLCAAYGLPCDVAMDDQDVLSTVMPEQEFKTFRGVLGHLHLTSRKRDPGLAILRSIAALSRRPSTPPDVI
jgi:N-acetyl-anhydromuramyl-L-alanine amidase AmpD